MWPITNESSQKKKRIKLMTYESDKEVVNCVLCVCVKMVLNLCTYIFYSYSCPCNLVFLDCVLLASEKIIEKMPCPFVNCRKRN